MNLQKIKQYILTLAIGLCILSSSNVAGMESSDYEKNNGKISVNKQQQQENEEEIINNKLYTLKAKDCGLIELYDLDNKSSLEEKRSCIEDYEQLNPDNDLLTRQEIMNKEMNLLEDDASILDEMYFLVVIFGFLMQN